MDIKHVLSLQPARPGLRRPSRRAPLGARRCGCVDVRRAALVEIGHDGDGFAFDNETPRHIVHLEPFRIADRLVTAGEWLAFIADDGYHRAELWLSDGWATVQTQRLGGAALLAATTDDGWTVFTLDGRAAASIPTEPVVHVSHYEADAFARWADAPAPDRVRVGGTRRRAPSVPAPDRRHDARARMPSTDGSPLAVGDVWQWTASAYLPYPRFRPAPARVGEYNGKFMSEPDGAARRRAASRRRPRRAHVPQLLPARRARWAFGGVRARPRPEAVRRTATRRSPSTSTSARRPATRSARRGPGSPRTRRTSRRSGSTTTAARSCSTRSPGSPEYYPTRAERAILDARAARSRRAHGTPTRSSSSARARRRRPGCCSTRMQRHGTLDRFVPFDVSEADAARRGRRDRSASTRRRRARRSSATSTATSSASRRGGRRLVAFLGGTIGNLAPDAARAVPAPTSRRCSTPTTASCSAPTSSRIPPASWPRTTTPPA